jgi:trk system potassium uptake protein TrkH
MVGSMITVMFSDLGPFEGFSGMASAVGNIGPFYFSVEKMISLSPVIKVTYIVGMLAGRLELLPLLVLFSRKSWR